MAIIISICCSEKGSSWILAQTYKHAHRERERKRKKSEIEWTTMMMMTMRYPWKSLTQMSYDSFTFPYLLTERLWKWCNATDNFSFLSPSIFTTALFLIIWNCLWVTIHTEIKWYFAHFVSDLESVFFLCVKRRQHTYQWWEKQQQQQHHPYNS